MMCECSRLTLRQGGGLRITCLGCDRVIWKNESMTLDEFVRHQKIILNHYGYDVDGHKIKANESSGVRTLKVMGPEALHQLEYDPNIKTTVTDRDMLLLHIDIALDKRDEVAFDLLVKELEGVK